MDLREYLKKAKEEGFIQEVESEVDWRLEAAAVSSLANRMGLPRPWFKKVRGYPEGYSLIFDPLSGKWERPWAPHALLLGFDPNIPYKEFFENVAQQIFLGGPVKPISISSGPCKEIVDAGDDANVLKFPFPLLTDFDGGRYTNYNVIIAKDPDSPWVNWSTYRAMIHSRKSIGMMFNPGQQTADLYYYKYEPREIDMPICISLGSDPLHFLASCTPFPAAISEAEIVGGIRKDPVKLVPSETSDLTVPADSEIVIEGVIRPRERADEGPAGEFFGFIMGPRSLMPVMRVTAVTHRENPILPVTNCAMHLSDCPSSTNFMLIPLFGFYKYAMGMPVESIRVPHPLFSCASKIAATNATSKEDVTWLAHNLWMTMLTAMSFQLVGIVDGDLDLTDEELVLEELMRKASVAEDWHDVGRAEGVRSWYSVFQTPQEKREGKPTAKVWIDGTTKEWDENKMGPKRCTYELLVPDEIRKRIDKEWGG